MSAAPDYIEPIVGWRSWLVVPEGERFRLRSVIYDALWLPRRELLARCLRSFSILRRRGSAHLSPAPRCGCGIYAASEPDEAASYLERGGWGDALSVLRAIGTVSLWGRIVVCTHGWRGSHAYPKTL